MLKGLINSNFKKIYFLNIPHPKPVLQPYYYAIYSVTWLVVLINTLAQAEANNQIMMNRMKWFIPMYEACNVHREAILPIRKLFNRLVPF